jgi:membrane protein
MDFRHIPSLLCESLKEWYGDNVSMLAAALAYYTLFAIAPMFIFIATIASIVFRREDIRQWLFSNAAPFLGPEVMDALRSILDNLQNPPATVIATTIGLVAFFFGTTRAVVHLRNSFNFIWKIPPRPRGGVWGTVKGRIMVFLIVIAAGFFLILLAMASAFLSAEETFFESAFPRLESILQSSNIFISLVFGTILFATMFKYIPAEKIAWTDVWIGAAVTSVLFVIGKHLLGMYFGWGAIHSGYGAAGSLVVIILWLYYSAHIVFFGAEFTQVYTRRYGTKICRRTEKNREYREDLRKYTVDDFLE